MITRQRIFPQHGQLAGNAGVVQKIVGNEFLIKIVWIKVFNGNIENICRVGRKRLSESMI